MFTFFLVLVFTVKMKSIKKGVSRSNRVKVWKLMNICFKKLRDFTDPSGSHNKMNTIQCSVVKGQDSYNNQNVQLKIDLRNNCYDVILLIDCIVYSYVIFVLALLLYYGLLTHYNSV